MDGFSPKEFLKARRPERFSDTSQIDTPLLDRAMLEYHRATVTTRGQENAFESFARAVVERTICPNLLPHTGPTGGGDSKVDSETYPVAELLALAWHVGNGNEAATERWAFAFSAKAKWQSKLQDDVAKIVKTERGYSKVFFATNQAVPDKKRAAMEDKLRAKYKIDVRILDQTFLLDSVFNHRLEELAIDRLQVEVRIAKAIKGPRDASRQARLDRLENEIQEAVAKEQRHPGLVDMCMRAAALARGLELPRVDVDGRYVRATRMAEQFGTPHQRICTVYEHAWTIYFWHEDYATFASMLQVFVEAVKDSTNPYQLELGCNLLNCALGAAFALSPAAAAIDISTATATLLSALHRVSSDASRPSASLHARSLHLQIQLVTADVAKRAPLLVMLEETIRKAKGLVGFPFTPLAEIVVELGKVFGTLPEYQFLYDTVTDATSQRSGELSRAKLLLARGRQLFDQDRPLEAIRALGQSLGNLFKEESTDEAFEAMYLCSHAYERLGLFWAARGTMLAAAALSINEFWSHDSITPQQAGSFNRLKWLELR